MSASAPDRNIEIGQRIRDFRNRKKIRQVDLAARAGVSWRHLIRIEKGEGGDSRPETLDRLAAVLGVKRQDLVGDDEDEAHPLSLDELLRRHVGRLVREAMAQ